LQILNCKIYKTMILFNCTKQQYFNMFGTILNITQSLMLAVLWTSYSSYRRSISLDIFCSFIICQFECVVLYACVDNTLSRRWVVLRSEPSEWLALCKVWCSVWHVGRRVFVFRFTILSLNCSELLKWPQVTRKRKN
jgi:hypothetical protein